MQNCESWAVWKIIVITGSIGLVLLLIGMFLGFRWKGGFCSIDQETKHIKLPNPLSMSEREDSESVGIHLNETGNLERSRSRARITYDHAGYESIDHVLEEIANREGEVPHPAVMSRSNSYESMDKPIMTEDLNSGRAMLGESTKYEDMGYAMPLEEVANREEIEKNRVHGHDSVTSEFRNKSCSHEQAEVVNTYSDRSRRDVDSYLELVSLPVNHYLDLCSNEENPCLDVGKKKVNPYLTLVHKEVNPYLGMADKEMDSHLDMGRKDVAPYFDMGKKDMDPDLENSPETSRAPASTNKLEADYLVLTNETAFYQHLSNLETKTMSEKDMACLDTELVDVGDGFHVFRKTSNKLCAHRLERVAFFWRLWIMGKGCILGDDTEVGKTIQVCVYLDRKFNAKLTGSVLF